MDRFEAFIWSKRKIREYLDNNNFDISVYNRIERNYPNDFSSLYTQESLEQKILNFKYVCRILNGIDFIVLKGLPLNYQVLPHIWNRRSSDIDILVKESHMDELAHILLENDFEYTGGIYTTYLNDTHIRYDDNHHMHSFEKRMGEQKIEIEPHRHPFAKKRIDYGSDNYTFDMNTMFRESITLNLFDDNPVRVLDLDRQFVQLIMHFTTHIFAEIRAFIFRLRDFEYPFKTLHSCALFYLANEDKLSLDKILNISHEWGVAHDVIYALRVMNEVYSIESDLTRKLVALLDENENPNRIGYRSFRLLFYMITQNKLVFKTDDIINMLQQNNYIPIQPN